MKIGFYTYQYIDKANLPIEEVLEKVAEDGYQGIDISATRGEMVDPSLFPQEDRRKYRDYSEQLGLEIEAVVTHLPMVNAVWEGQAINLHGAVDLALDVGAKIVSLHIGSYQNTQNSFDLAWESAVEHLKDVTEFAEARGVIISIDAIMPDTLLDTPELMDKFIRAVGSPVLKHTFDPCYLAMQGYDLAKAVRELKDHICHVHVKDFRGRSPEYVFAIPGDGRLDIKKFMNALKRIKYDGYVTVECFKEHELSRASRVGFRALSRHA